MFHKKYLYSELRRVLRSVSKQEMIKFRLTTAQSVQSFHLLNWQSIRILVRASAVTYGIYEGRNFSGTKPYLQFSSGICVIFGICERRFILLSVT